MNEQKPREALLADINALRALSNDLEACNDVQEYRETVADMRKVIDRL